MPKTIIRKGLFLALRNSLRKKSANKINENALILAGYV